VKLKMLWNFSLAILFAFLTSCATQYRPDLTDRSTARVRMATTYPAQYVFTAVLKKSCVTYSTIEWDKNAMMIEGLIPTSSSPLRKSIGIPKSEISNQGDFVEVLIPSDEPINLGFLGMKVGYSGNICMGGVKFTPEKGRDYEISFVREGYDCITSLRRLSLDRQGRMIYDLVIGAENLPEC
jgi:hypothetical protein